MRYQFDSKEEIYDCKHCPFRDPIIIEENVYERYPWECWINKRRLTDGLRTKPDWCPLVEIKEGKVENN